MGQKEFFDRSGEVLDGRYRLEQLLDRGGQGAIYRALDLRQGDHVAVKLLIPKFAHDPDSRDRLLREAQALMTLGGTAAVRVLDQRWNNSEPCLVLELLEGQSLEELLTSGHPPCSLAEVDAWLGPIVHTLHVAHEHGIIHRDLKPGNIFLSQHGVRLLDFGFAKFRRLLSFTAAGMAAGSPSYMAPEIWNAAPVIDHRIDIYALGVLVYRLLSGELPFASKELGVLRSLVISAPRPSLRARRADLPIDVDGWCHQALAADPDARFLNIRAAWRSFRHAAELGPEPIVSSRPGPSSPR